MATTLDVFTDGSCINNGRPDAVAGYATVFPEHPDWNEAARLGRGERQTNNRGELWGILRAFQIAKEKQDEIPDVSMIVIYTDSQLCVNTFTKWIIGWRKKGWRKADGGPIENLDLIQRVYELMLWFQKEAKWSIGFSHVRAHTRATTWEARWNDVADRMAQSVVEK